MNTEMLVKTGERMDDLQRNGLRILQNPERFCFGMDAVLLANFCHLRLRDRVADFGTGTGILPLLMSQNEPTASFEAIELQPDMADMAYRSVLLNQLENRIAVHCRDLRETPEMLGKGSMDVVVCNPPYGKQGSTLHNPNMEKSLACHEEDIRLSEILKAAEELLKYHGRLYMVFPANRMVDLLESLRVHHLEPKRIRMVVAKLSKPPYILLIEASKQANPFLLWEPPLVVYDENGRETPEMDRIYHRI